MITKGQITIVDDPQFDPVYSSYLEILSEFDLLKTKNPRKNQVELHSIAFAIANNINYFSTNDRAARIACEEIDICSSILVIGLEDLLVIAEKTIAPDKVAETRKVRKAIYKIHCKRQNYPKTFSAYYKEFVD
ncbi:MAG: hypothetical protein JJE21_11135 [Spirochaetaceae bacterium]|nr:hypothetical protein [Spirochaetaceae bacterium]